MRKNFTKLDISLNENIKCVRAGNDYFLILTQNNSLYGYGFNLQGEMGLQIDQSNDSTEIVFTKIEHNLQIKDLQCSDNHSIILDIFGNIYTTGLNDHGQLGLGDFKDKCTFTKVELPFKVIKIYADNLASLIISEKNELYGAGYNQDGNLGVGSRENLKTFTKITINNFNTNYYGFSFSQQLSTFIVDGNNKIFISGGYHSQVERFGITTVPKEVLTEFKEVNVKFTKRNFVYVFPVVILTVIVSSDYQINCDEKENLLSLKCFQKVSKKQLIDVSFVCDDFN